MNNESRLTSEATEAIKFLLTSTLKVGKISDLIKVSPPTLYAILKKVKKEQLENPLVQEKIKKLQSINVFESNYEHLNHARNWKLRS